MIDVNDTDWLTMYACFYRTWKTKIDHGGSLCLPYYRYSCCFMKYSKLNNKGFSETQSRRGYRSIKQNNTCVTEIYMVFL